MSFKVPAQQETSPSKQLQRLSSKLIWLTGYLRPFYHITVSALHVSANTAKLVRDHTAPCLVDMERPVAPPSMASAFTADSVLGLIVSILAAPNDVDSCPVGPGPKLTNSFFTGHKMAFVHCPPMMDVSYYHKGGCLNPITHALNQPLLQGM